MELVIAAMVVFAVVAVLVTAFIIAGKITKKSASETEPVFSEEEPPTETEKNPVQLQETEVLTVEEVLPTASGKNRKCSVCGEKLRTDVSFCQVCGEAADKSK